MKKRYQTASLRAVNILGILALAIAGGNFLTQTVQAGNAPETTPGAWGFGNGRAAEMSVPYRTVCAHATADGVANCDAHVVSYRNGTPFVNTLPSGYGPKQLLGAYGLSGTNATNPIVAIVDAYDDPNITADLNTYSTTYGIPKLPTCVGAIASSAVPCFKKVNQSGGSFYPSANSGWALEIALDAETVHAVCQSCRIVLVEASSPSFTNLGTAENQAVTQGATAISNSWGASEFAGETGYDSYFNHPGVAITFSSGDSGYGTSYPAASQYVTAVGGTSLQVSPTNTFVSESVWNGTGSGCSAYVAKPSWQTDAGCANRTIADVSADADPSTGAAVFDSYRYYGYRGWFVVGGTSLASPIIASTYALAGPVTSPAASLPYAQLTSTNLHDVTTGSNGFCGSYLCQGAIGYDGPSGLGSPNGTTAF